jgi:hypothetical protein
MTPRQLFQMNSEKLDILSSLLDNPTIKEALFIVRQECSPKEPVLKNGENLKDVLSLEAGKSIGANEFFAKLQSLANPPMLKDNKLDQEYIQQARKKLFSTGLYTIDEINEAERLSQLNTQQE